MYKCIYIGSYHKRADLVLVFLLSPFYVSSLLFKELANTAMCNFRSDVYDLENNTLVE